MTVLAPDTRAPDSSPTTPSRFTRLLRGQPGDPRWVRPALYALLIGTGVLYIAGLGASGWANEFYSAAVQAGASSWKAMFFGSSDAAGSITVDKPPAALWIMDISARIFGVNSWSILVPQALEGAASAGLLYATVRRWFSPGAGLLAGAVLALTPVAVLMFRYNNPDSLLVLLLIAAVYATVRALENGSTKWLMWAGAFVGFGFITKMLQAFLVLPALAVVYVVCAPGGLGKRIRQTLLAGLAVVVAAGWWVAIVALIPAADRPYIGGSQTNSVLELAFGYNGFGRLTGDETGGLGNTNQDVGITRLFESDMGGQIAWLLPAALILLIAGIYASGRAKRTDRPRAAFLIWGGWLVVTGLVFSLGNGIIHPYYTVALAPAIGALVGMGAGVLWPRRKEAWACLTLAGTIAVSSVWAAVLLGRTSDWLPWLRIAVPVAGLIGAVLILLNNQVGQLVAKAGAIVALLAVLAGPTAYAVDTATSSHSGAIPSAGPGGFGFGGGGGPGGGRGGFGGGNRTGGFGGGQGNFGGGQGGNFPGGNFTGGQNGTTNGNGGTTGTGGQAGGTPGGGRFGGGGGGLAGIIGDSTANAQVVALLKQNANAYTWVAATVGSNNAASYQLATDSSVMPLGGYNGTDPSPTLAQFEAYVKAGKIHYFIGSGSVGFGGMGGQSSGSNDASEIASWVAQHYTAQTVGGVTVYDLTKAAK